MFEIYHPNKYNKDYVRIILQENVNKEHELYEQFCSKWNETPLPLATIPTESVSANSNNLLSTSKSKQSKKKRKSSQNASNKKQRSKNKKNKKKNVVENEDENSLTSNERSNMIGMFRKQLISMDNKQQQHSSNGNSPIETLDFQIRIIVRFRPVNDKEKAIEQRIMFRNEFDMDDNDFDRFMKCRMLLMQNEESLIDWRVDEVCAWLETMEYDLSVVGRFRRRKVNGDWLLNFPPFLEKKPLEIERDCVVSFNMKDQSHTYESDVVLNDNCTQDECFQEIGPPIVHDIIAGYNYTIFAYGQVLYYCIIIQYSTMCTILIV